MVEEAIHTLMKNGFLTVPEALDIANGSGPITDRLMAVIRKLPGVTHDRRPRVLYYSKDPQTD